MRVSIIYHFYLWKEKLRKVKQPLRIRYQLPMLTWYFTIKSFELIGKNNDTGDYFWNKTYFWVDFLEEIDDDFVKLFVLQTNRQKYEGWSLGPHHQRWGRNAERRKHKFKNWRVYAWSEKQFFFASKANCVLVSVKCGKFLDPLQGVTLWETIGLGKENIWCKTGVGQIRPAESLCPAPSVVFSTQSLYLLC